MPNLPLAKLTTALTLSLLASTSLAAPEGVGPFIVPMPEVAYPLPVVDNYMAQTGRAADGAEISKYDRAQNPILAILSGFDGIWSLGDEAWRSGGANGDGARDYAQVKIVDPLSWRANIAYVEAVTQDRGPEEARLAYLDDRRSKAVSVLDGFGPLQAAYLAHSGAGTTIDLATDPLVNFDDKVDDHGTRAGLEDSALGDFVRFYEAFRGPEGTTSPAKYFYASPRPWRMNHLGETIKIGTEQVRGETIDRYQSDVVIVPALSGARETRGRHKDGGFPSGHTNAGYMSAFAYAYATPERFSELLTRASELGESRIVAGMHSPVDVIGGRIMSTAVAAAYLNDPRFEELKRSAFENIHAVMADQARGAGTLAEFAQSGLNDSWADDELNKELYTFRMTYGLPQNPDEAGQDMIVPKGAEVLLETRLPYLNAEQRRAVLYTTGIDSGYPLLDGSNGWGRLNLLAAADGYGTFPGDVEVTMDATDGGFSVADSWDNDISGPGMLTKAGSGTLTLTGDNSYEGGTVLAGGTLVAATRSALGTGDVRIEGGVLQVTSEGLDLAELEVTDGVLVVDLTEAEPGARLPVIRTAGVIGDFAAVQDMNGKALNFQTENGVISVRVPATEG